SEDLPYLRLFSLLLPQVGCGPRNYVQNLEYLLQHTGGVGVSLDLSLQAESAAQMRPALIIRGKALNRKLEYLFPLFRDLITNADFSDVERLKELLMQHLHGMENSIQHSSLRFAINLAGRGFSKAGTLSSLWYGLDYFWFLKELVSSFEKNPQPLIEKLHYIQKHVLGTQGAHLVLGCDEESLIQLKKEGFYGLSDLPLHPFTPWNPDYPIMDTPSQARIIASPVAFTTLLFPSIPYTHPLSAALSLASEIMENRTLHKKIREKGGAYGSGAVSTSVTEQFYFYSYRDPHLKSTLKAFYEAVQGILSMKFNEKDLEEAKFGLFQDLDAPIPPSSRAITAYGRLRGGRTAERRQSFRDALLACSKEDIRRSAHDILI
ncbi:MAG: insulinase family protein, partial [Chlamydiia bacterium]|nr:insulinase family protein [Chlamydiia bacterium]